MLIGCCMVQSQSTVKPHSQPYTITQTHHLSYLTLWTSVGIKRSLTDTIKNRKTHLKYTLGEVCMKIVHCQSNETCRIKPLCESVASMSESDCIWYTQHLHYPLDMMEYEEIVSKWMQINSTNNMSQQILWSKWNPVSRSVVNENTYISRILTGLETHTSFSQTVWCSISLD